MEDHPNQQYESETPAFEVELQRLLNKHSIDNRLGIADYELTEILINYLAVIANVKRREWKEDI